MKIGVLTSSRADYSIYLPLLKELKEDSFFELQLIAFGTHLSKKHGYTIQQLRDDGFTVDAEIDGFPESDTPQEIAKSMATTMAKFSEFWMDQSYDLVFCFGDRFEMFAACAASVPFGIKLAHLHGGETTLGAIDNVFRHSISLMSKVHFSCTEQYKNRILELLDVKANVYNVGALSFDNLKHQTLMSTVEFDKKFGVDLSKPTVLITFHPETLNYAATDLHMDELISALNQLSRYQFLITMPNADTSSESIRKKWKEFIALNHNSAFGFENLGTLGYLSAMKHCQFLLGNSSSGCIEAAYFPKWVINLGERQKGRISSTNRLDCSIQTSSILNAVAKIEKKAEPLIDSILYGDGEAAKKITAILKNI